MRNFKRLESPEMEDVVFGKLRERFIVPPFSVLDRRSGAWKNQRKRWAWLPDDTAGRAAGLTYGMSQAMLNFSPSGTSAFDPFLAELIYAWFCPPRGAVLDPFSGGITRGAVAAAMGLHYRGQDIRPEQVSSNRDLWSGITCSPSILREYGVRTPVPPEWICDDSAVSLPAGDYDFILTSPGYHDTEVYSDLPGDVSSMDELAYADAFSKIVQNCFNLLKENRFAAFNVGNTRDSRDGHYRDLHGLTVKAGLAAGFKFWNDLIIIDPVASKVLYAERCFERSRKVPHCHQYVVILLKGDPVLAANSMREF